MCTIAPFAMCITVLCGMCITVLLGDAGLSRFVVSAVCGTVFGCVIAVDGVAVSRYFTEVGGARSVMMHGATAMPLWFAGS